MRRKPWLSALLSILLPGLGQMYNGQMKKGIILYLSFLFIGFISGIWPSLLPLKVIGVFLCLFLQLLFVTFYVVIEAFITAKKIGDDFVPRAYNKWQVYLTVYLVVGFLITSLYTFGLRTFLIQAYKIPSESMRPTFEVGDHLFVNKFYYRKTNPKRGDLIVFKYPEEQKRDFIKRIIALPGEEIMIKNKKVYINGKELKESYIIHTDSSSHLQSPRDNLEKPIIIPQNHYFVLGDNRDSCFDSRFWGTVPEELIRGKAFMIYWPPDRIMELK